jgi:hypothetical protein
MPETMKTIINSDLPSAHSQRTTMKTIMKMDPPSSKLSALRRPQRGADTCDYGLQQVILHGNIVGHVTTSWVDSIQEYVALWEIKVVPGKGHGIVANMHVPKGTMIAIYGGNILYTNKVQEGIGSHVWQMKDSGKTLVIDGFDCEKLPKFAQAALANEPDNCCPNAKIVWLSWSKKRSLNLFTIPVLKTEKDIDEGQEITIKYSANSYYPVAIAY